MSLFSTTLNSPIGNIEITGDESSIYSVLFKDTPDYPEAPTNPVLDDCKKQLREYFDGKIRKFYLPLKQEGTVFQQDVWTELCNIPFGRCLYRYSKENQQ